MNRILFVFGAGVAMAMSAVPAMAGTAPPISVPEPATMSLVAVGIGGAYLAKKFFGRK